MSEALHYSVTPQQGCKVRRCNLCSSNLSFFWCSYSWQNTFFLFSGKTTHFQQVHKSLLAFRLESKLDFSMPSLLLSSSIFERFLEFPSNILTKADRITNLRSGRPMLAIKFVKLVLKWHRCSISQRIRVRLAVNGLAARDVAAAACTNDVIHTTWQQP